MNDNYTHDNMMILYTPENIPGPAEDSEDYKNIIDNFNSQLTNHCQCKHVCTYNCLCLNNFMKSTSLNFSYNELSKSIPFRECNKLCLCPEKCVNRVVQKGPLAGLTVKSCKKFEKGKGLYTEQFIPKGTFICEYAGEVITKSEAKKRHYINRLKGHMNYIFCLNEYCNGNMISTIIDPSDFGNIGRYINHSCKPNCIVVPVRINCPIPSLAIFSCIDVLQGTELTFDYGSHHKSSINQKDSDKMVTCLCESEGCRGLLPCDMYDKSAAY